MSRGTRNTLIAVAALVVVIAGAFGAVWFFSGGSGEASREISAPTLEVPATEEANPAATEETGSSTGTLFQIVSEESEVNFQIAETLMGNAITVVGSTDEVAGQIFVDFDNPQNSQIGTIRINMRTLTTDNEFRNRALRNDILQTNRDEYEFSDFVPTSIEGLPESVTIGEAFTFKITGTLTLRGTPQPVTFDVTVTPVSETRLEGTATSVVRYQDVGIDIPNVPPSVANIGEEVTLNLNFVATAAENSDA
jgi:polyisoprenoid-binding protein YceI